MLFFHSFFLIVILQVTRCCSVAEFHFFSNKKWQRKAEAFEKRLNHCFSNIHLFQNWRQCNEFFHWVMSYVSFFCEWKKKRFSNKTGLTEPARANKILQILFFILFQKCFTSKAETLWPSKTTLPQSSFNHNSNLFKPTFKSNLWQINFPDDFVILATFAPTKLMFPLG